MRGKSGGRGARVGGDAAASMRPAHYAREVLERSELQDTREFASMRPAHYAREVWTATPNMRSPPCCFNEARALCAGSLRGRLTRTPRLGCFNEARALCAGSQLTGARRADLEHLLQ